MKEEGDEATIGKIHNFLLKRMFAGYILVVQASASYGFAVCNHHPLICIRYTLTKHLMCTYESCHISYKLLPNIHTHVLWS